MTQQYTTDGYPYPPAPPAPEKKPGGLSKGVWAAIIGGAVALVAIVVLVLVLALGGNDDKKEPEAAPAPVTVTATPEAEPRETKSSSTQILSDEAFVDYILEQRPVLSFMSDEEIVDLAKDSCERFDEGESAMTVITDSVEGVTDKDEAEAIGFTIGTGVQNYCGEHVERLEAELDKLNT